MSPVTLIQACRDLGRDAEEIAVEGRMDFYEGRGAEARSSASVAGGPAAR